MSQYTYVETAPPAMRRPPVTEVGVLGWMRNNLFSTWYNTLLTVGATLFAVYAAVGLLNWVVGTANWDVVTYNLRLFGSGRYPPAQVWRVSLVALIVVFLSGLSWGLWGRMSRLTAVGGVAVVALVFALPMVGGLLPLPPTYALPNAATTAPVPPLAFVGDAGQTLHLALTPTTRDAPTPKGFIGTASRTAWGEFSRSALEPGQVDDLTATVRLHDIARESVLATLQVQAGSESASAEVALPHDAWYVLSVEVEGESGAAWLSVEGLLLMSSQSGAQQDYASTYGPAPTTFEGERVRVLDNAWTRFVGTRTLVDFMTLVVTPFTASISTFVLAVTLSVFIGYAAGLALKRLGGKLGRRLAVAAWVLSFPLTMIILRGLDNSTALPMVGTDRWGGLLLTLVLAVVGIVAAFPIGVLAALGRRSSLPVVRTICTLYIEFVRGVPLVTVIWAANVMVPLAEPRLAGVDSVIRAMVGMTLFTGAYLAENVRGGLQAIPRGQEEAARAVGMNTLLVISLITLPQALRAVIPAIAGLFISLFKDTSLVVIIGLMELLGIARSVISQAEYVGTQREAFVFIAVIYFVFSYAMSSASRRLEASGSGAVRRL